MRKNFIFAFYVIAGILLGSLVAALAANVSWLAWLRFGVDIGLGADAPAVLDLSVLKLAFGINISVTIAHVITIATALLLHSRRGK